MESLSPNDRSVYVLHIGRPLAGPGFTSPTWKVWAKWCSLLTNELVIYLWQKNSESDTPEVVGKRIAVTADNSETTLRQLLFNVEYGVVHLSCFLGETLTADLDTIAGDNYLLLFLTKAEADSLCGAIGDTTVSQQQCAQANGLINSMFSEPTEWTALGA